LRIGAMMKTILPALAHAVVFDRKCAGGPLVSLEAIKTQLQSLSTEVAEAYNVIPNLVSDRTNGLCHILIQSWYKFPSFGCILTVHIPGN
jgi:hypothetical protein